MTEDEDEEREEREEKDTYGRYGSWKKAKLPNLDDFGDSYKDTLGKTKEFYKETGDLTGPFKKFIKGNKKCL